MAQNPRDFKADSHQVGNLIRALSESADGDLVFRDEFYPAGIRLRDFLSVQVSEDIINSIIGPISGNLQNQITLNDLDIDTLFSLITSLSASDDDIYSLIQEISANLGSLQQQVDDLDLTYATDASLIALSGNLQPQIWSNDVDIYNLRTDVNTISGNLSSLQTQVNNLDLTYATDTSVANISGYLQSQITANDVDIATIFAQLEDISGGGSNSLSLIYALSAQQQADFSNLQGEIWDNDTDITGLRTDVNTISGDLDILEQQFADLDLTYATDASLIALSGDLQPQIWSNDTDIFNLRTDVDSISGQVLSNDLDIQNLQDTTLTINNNPSLSGNETSQLKVDTTGNITRHEYAPIIGGQIALNTVDSAYTITDSNILPTSNPVCSIVPPMSGATIYSHSVYGISNGYFMVELSESPAISGYNLNWMSLQFV